MRPKHNEHLRQPSKISQALSIAALVSAMTMGSTQAAMPPSISGTPALSDNEPYKLMGQVGPATLSSYKGLKVMHLYGTREEMAYQHGVFAQQNIDLPNSSPGFFLKAIDQALAGLSGIMGKLKRLYIVEVVEPSLQSHLSNDEFSALQAFQRGSNYKLRDILNAAIFPDMAQFLEAKQYGNFKTLGCASLIVEPQKSKEGLLHARDLDFFSEGLWERQAVVIYMHPSEPGSQWYAGIGTIGLLVASPTTFNESGIIMDMHQLTTRDVDPNGTPILFAIQRVIMQAHTLDEAIEALRATHFTSPWKINISSAKEGKSAFIDVAPSTFSVYRTQDSVSVSTNDVADSETSRKFEYLPNYNSKEDSLGRYRVAKTLSSQVEKFTVQNAIDIISSHTSDISGKLQLSSHHGVVARIDNIQSVVFQPQNQTIWMSTPLYDFATPNDGQYVALPWNGDFSRFQERPSLRSSEPLPANIIKARAVFRKALQVYENGDPTSQMIPYVTRAEKLDPAQPSHSVILGLLYLQNVTSVDTLNTNVPLALAAFQRALSKDTTPYYQSLIHLLIGRCYLLLGQPENAAIPYARVDAKIWPRISDALSKDLAQGYQIADIQSLDVDYYDADLYGF